MACLYHVRLLSMRNEHRARYSVYEMGTTELEQSNVAVLTSSSVVPISETLYPGSMCIPGRQQLHFMAQTSHDAKLFVMKRLQWISFLTVLCLAAMLLIRMSALVFWRHHMVWGMVAMTMLID